MIVQCRYLFLMLALVAAIMVGITATVVHLHEEDPLCTERHDCALCSLQYSLTIVLGTIFVALFLVTPVVFSCPLAKIINLSRAEFTLFSPRAPPIS